MIRSLPMMLCLILSLGGCAAVGQYGSSLKYQIQGERYLQKQEYRQGLETFGQAVQADRTNPEAHYYYGRMLLAENDAGKALPYLKQATALQPDKSEYHFWLGVAYGEAGQGDLEQKSYQHALELDPENGQALTYLGNNRLRASQYREALGYYDKALALSDSNPQALYNRAVCLRQLGRLAEEKSALLHSLAAHPSGNFARLAADRLNSLGDYSYRNYRLGLRVVTLTRIDFAPSSDQLSETAYPSLDLVGRAVANMPQGTLNIIVYQQKNRDLAKRRALAIHDYLDKHYPGLQENKRIRISWFGSAEKRLVLKKNQSLKESVQFFLTDFEKKQKSIRTK